MVKTLATVKGLGKIVEVTGAFDNILTQLKNEKALIVSPRNEALARVKTYGNENIGESYGTWTRAGFEYVRGELPILRLHSRLLTPKLAEHAVQANKDGNYFYTPTTKQYEASLKQAEKDKEKEPSKRSVIVLPSRNTFEMSPNQNWEVLEFALKDQAQPLWDLYSSMYDSLLKTYLASPEIVDAQDGTLMTQLWFGRADVRFDFNGSGVLDCGNRARGVSKNVPKARAPRKSSGEEIVRPNLVEIVKFSRKYVPKVAQPDFKEGLKELFDRE